MHRVGAYASDYGPGEAGPGPPRGKQNAPLGDHLTTLTACVCFANVDKYSTFRPPLSQSTFHSCEELVSHRSGVMAGNWGPYPHVVVSASSGQPAFAARLEVGRINGRILVVPVYN